MDSKKNTPTLMPGALADANLLSATSALEFAGFRLETDGTFFRGNAMIHLPPRELAALQLLLAHAGQVVTSAQMKEALWGDVHVTADSVMKCLSSLRARLAPDECIQTVYKRGYRLMAEVRTQAGSAAQPTFTSAALPRLAIQPFATEFGVPEHLGSAISEEAIARLSNLSKPLALILARESVFSLTASGMSAQQLGEALNADLVLTGTLRALSASYWLRAEMIRIADGVQIWAEDMLVERHRIGGLESDLMERLADRLGQKANCDAGPGDGTDEVKAATLERPVSMKTLPSLSAAAEQGAERVGNAKQREAYEAYQRGRHEWQSLERHRMQDGLQLLVRATDLDPTFLPARIDLSYLAISQGFYGFMASRFVADVVRGCAAPISDFSSDAAAMLPSLGWIQFHFDRDLGAAADSFRDSAHVPHNPWITRMRSMFALSRRRYAEAVELIQSAIRKDSFSPWLHARLAWTLHLDGQAEASVKQAEHALELFPGHEGPAMFGGMILAFNGKAERAVELAGGLAKGRPHFDLATAIHAYALACAGRTAEARAMLDRLRWLSGERYVVRAFNAAAYVALGDHKAAIAELQASDSIRCPWFFQMLADPRLKPLRESLEFKQLEGISAQMEGNAHGADFAV